METANTKRLVLGEGETVGHKHVLNSEREFEFARLNISTLLILPESGVLTHDEHDRIVLFPARNRSYNQVEFNPMDQTIVRVFD